MEFSLRKEAEEGEKRKKHEKQAQEGMTNKA